MRRSWSEKVRVRSRKRSESCELYACCLVFKDIKFLMYISYKMQYNDAGIKMVHDVNQSDTYEVE